MLEQCIGGGANIDVHSERGIEERHGINHKKLMLLILHNQDERHLFNIRHHKWSRAHSTVNTT